MKRIIFFIAENGFRDEELFEPKEVLESQGFSCDITSTKDEAHGKMGAIVMTDISLQEVKVNNYDAFVLVGGPGAPTMSKNPRIISILQEAYSKNKLLCAICIAPTILAEHRFLAGKNATVWSGGKDILITNQVNYIPEPVVFDDSDKNHKFITADGPKSATAFGQKIAEILLKEI